MVWYLSRKGVYHGPRGSFWADFDIFEILGDAGDINKSTSMLNYRNGLHGDLGMYVNKVLSAWTEV